MKLLIIACIVVICVCVCLLGLMRLDREQGMKFTADLFVAICAGGLISGWIWLRLTADEPWPIRLAWLILHIYFLCCSITDYQTCQVYDIFQYIGIGTSAYLLLTENADMKIGFSIILFGMLQYFLFMRLYGKADGMTFLVAALAEGVLGYHVTGYLFHMIMAYLMLSLIQAVKGNIGRRGRLKKAVPFLPYITVSFWVMLVYAKEIQAWL